MAVLGDDEFEGYASAPERGRMQFYLNTAGAVTSIALVAGLAVWGYNLAVRDVSGIPVVRALEGPMRIAPQEPGGEIAANVGLSVNEVAAEGSVAPLPDQMVLAPRPVDLSADDQPVAMSSLEQAGAEVATLAALPAVEAPVGADPLASSPPAAEVSSDAALESAVNDALSEALGDDATLVAAESAPPGAIVRSPRPERRPEGDGSAEAEIVPVSVDATVIESAGEVDIASVAAGTRLVQLGAYDNETDARAEWAKLQAQFGDLIAPKALVLQQAESGGRSFVRLRAMGFEDEADARRFCSALLAENASCIPVAHRP
ncbi:MAG: SPOR domain-containing protein [Cereibacter sphaeroides]|uniref:SPOR domain-containing protein n=1 Tax=Cereibacter sphaeroides TaxID=1063 RepID=A0A2W5SCU7_CERSP|nr:MAG: SPOR domain-containing protein [Cereibacter sphaeroides]